MWKKKKPFYLKMEEGSGANVIVLFNLFIFLLILLTILQLGYHKVKVIKYQADNGVVLSAVAANVADFYEYATYERLLLDCSGTKTDAFGRLPGTAPETQYDTDLYGATKRAYGFAFQRFQEAFAVNVGPLTKSGRDWQLELEDFRIYNVYNEDVYVSENISSCIVYENQAGILRTPNDVLVYQSGIYVKIKLKVHYMTIRGHSYDYTIPIEEFIDMKPSNELT